MSGYGDAGRNPCAPCQAGDGVNLSTNWTGYYEFHSGPATINGTNYARLYFSGTLSFQVAPLTMPSDDSATFTLSVPFSLSGNINFYLDNPEVNPGPALFSTLLSGQGIAFIQIESIFSPSYGHLYFGHGTTYSFQPTATPEPTTLLLLGTGLVGVARAVRSKRRKKSSEPSNL
jgi:hypothetical protein